MGLTKRKDGLYVQFPVVDDGKVLAWGRGNPVAKLKRWKTHTTNKTMAKQQEAKIKTDLMMGKISSEKIKVITFGQWCETYLKLESVKKLRTYVDRTQTIKYQLLPYFGMRKLNEISPEDIEDYRGKRLRRDGNPAALGTINKDHMLLKHMFGVAIKRGLLETNAAKKVAMPDPQNERDKVLNNEEWNRLYESAATHLRPILLVAYHLGPRLGEILQLTWDRVDLQRGIIKLRSVDTKTKEPRLVPMTQEVWQVLREQAKVRSMVVDRVFLFEGRPLKGIKRAFRTAVRKAKIEDFRFHDLRHCAATNLRRAGVDTITAMRVVGHKSERMHRRYNSVSEGDLLAAASKLNTYLTPAPFVDSGIPVSY